MSRTASALDVGLLRTSDIDGRALRNAFGAIPSAVAVLAIVDRDSPLRSGEGMTVATLLPVSLDPPCLGVMVQRDSTTWPALAASEAIGVSVLADHQAWIGRRIATGARGERFAGVPAHRSATGTALFIDDAAVRFEVTVSEQTPAGDHLFALLEVHSLHVDARTRAEHLPPQHVPLPARGGRGAWCLDVATRRRLAVTGRTHDTASMPISSRPPSATNSRY